MTNGNQVVILWGRTGNRPQVSVKTYADEKAARDELNRLEEEQIQKGYVPLD